MRRLLILAPISAALMLSACMATPSAGGGGSRAGGGGQNVDGDESSSRGPATISVGSIAGDLDLTDNLSVPSGRFLTTDGRSNLREGIGPDTVAVRFNSDDTIDVALFGDEASEVYRFTPLEAPPSSSDDGFDPWTMLSLADDTQLRMMAEATGSTGNPVILAQVAPDDAYFVMNAVADMRPGSDPTAPRFDNYAYFVVGEETDNAVGNLNGTATYTGQAFGTVVHADTNRLVDSLAGTVEIDADFTDNFMQMFFALNGSKRNYDLLAIPWDSNAPNMAGSSFWTQLTGGGLSRGEAKGRFYGPDAVNAAGVFEGINDSTRHRIEGVFGATQ